MNLTSFLPGLSRPDIAQMSIFLTIFTCSVFGMAGNWPGVSYLINNGTLLFICMFTIGLPNAKSHYLFSYALLLSPVIDAFSIGFNWELYDEEESDFIFYWSLVFALILTVSKIFFSMHQLEIAKTLNNELSPVTEVYKIHAIQQLITPPAKQQNGKANARGGVSAAAAASSDVEAIPLKPIQKKNGQPASSSVKSVPVKIEKEVQETSIQKPSVVQAPVEEPTQKPTENTANSPAILVESPAPVPATAEKTEQ